MLVYDAGIVVFLMGSNDTKPENWFGEFAFKTALLDLLDDYTQGEKKSIIYISTSPACFFMEDSEGELTSHDLRPAYAEIIRETPFGSFRIDRHGNKKQAPSLFFQRGRLLIKIYGHSRICGKGPRWLAAGESLRQWLWPGAMPGSPTAIPEKHFPN